MEQGELPATDRNHCGYLAKTTKADGPIVDYILTLQETKELVNGLANRA